MKLFKTRKGKIFLVSVASLIIVLFAVARLFISARSSDNAKKEAKAVEVNSLGKKFGLSLDSFNTTEATIEKNEFLSDILNLYHVDNTTIALLARKAKDVFDVRDLAAGNSYTVFSTKDSLQKAEYFVYQPNAIDYVVYDLRDSLNVYKAKRKVTTKTVTFSGTINSSLYETFADKNTDAGLAVKMADIFAWTIDFYAIQAGDWFKLVYEQRYVKGEPVEIGNIESAVFSHSGEEFYAFYFQPDSTKAGEYFNEKGESLKKAFLKAPLKFSRISSRYTLRRFHPVQKRWKAHLGTDYAAPTGTPIICTGNGVVIASAYTKYNGNYVKVKHNGTYTTQYLHMSKRAVRVGQHVNQGQVIGYVGSTGLATGPHVCYRFWKNGKQVDPLRQKFPAATPVPKDELASFNQLVKVSEAALNNTGVDTTYAGL